MSIQTRFLKSGENIVGCSKVFRGAGHMGFFGDNLEMLSYGVVASHLQEQSVIVLGAHGGLDLAKCLKYLCTEGDDHGCSKEKGGIYPAERLGTVQSPSG